MKKYIFVTYGSKRIKGVQTKAINIARYLPKEDVLVINHGDSSWIEKAGLDFYNTNFNTFVSPEKMDPKIIECLTNANILIFCDFPTNMVLETSIFWYTYTHLKIPIYICDNIYNKTQFKIKTDSIFYKLGDKLILSGLEMFRKDFSEFPKTVLIPPFFPTPIESRENLQKVIAEKFKVNFNQGKTVLYIAYNNRVFEISKLLILNPTDLPINHIIIVPGETEPGELDSLKELKNVSIITGGDLTDVELRDLTISSDVIICKFGYQQFLDSLSLQKPTIPVGDSGLNEFWLDPQLKQCFNFYEDYSPQLLEELQKLLSDNEYFDERVKKISELHNGAFDGGKIAAAQIEAGSKMLIENREKLPKVILLSFNTNENLEKIKQVMKKEMFVLPIIVSNRFAEREFGYEKGTLALAEKLTDFDFYGNDDYLNSSSSLLFNLSAVAYHGLAPILPFFTQILQTIANLVEESDKVYVVGKEAKTFFDDLTRSVGKDQVVFVD